MRILGMLIGAIIAAVIAAPGFAQGAFVPFGGITHDNLLPIEISADSLSISQADSSAEFLGNVQVGQGSLKISADRIFVKYAASQGEATGQIQTIEATGNVLFTNGAEAAEGQTAVYDVATGIVKMTGDVILTQGMNALSGESLTIDLTAGTALVGGRVQTIFQPGKNP